MNTGVIPKRGVRPGPHKTKRLVRLLEINCYIILPYESHPSPCRLRCLLMTTAAHVPVNFQNNSDKSASGEGGRLANKPTAQYCHQLLWRGAQYKYIYLYIHVLIFIRESQKI